MSDLPLPATTPSAVNPPSCDAIHNESAFSSKSPSPPRAGSITIDPKRYPILKSGLGNSSTLANRVAAFGSHSPVLSERDSIFATHWTPVVPAEDDGSHTPHLLCPAGVVTPSSGSVTNTGVRMELELPMSSKLSFKPLPQSSQSPKETLGIGGTQDRSWTAATRIALNGTIGGIRRVASEGPLRGSKSQGKDKGSPILDSKTNILAMSDKGKMEGKNIETDGNVIRDQLASEPHRPSARPSAMGEALQLRRSERSTSRGRSHVEKSIEATLANADPGKNVRSRKSSHYMGLFKDKIEPKKRDITIKGARPSTSGNDAPGPRPEGTRSREEFGTTDISASPAPTDPAQQTAKLDSLMYTSATREESSVASVSATDVQTTSSSHMDPVLSLKHSHDPYFRKQDQLSNTASPSRSPIPASLLEQIRHHNLMPMRAQGMQKLPIASGFTEDIHDTYPNRRTVPEGDIIELEDNAEHISSAVYYPHPGPTQEEIENFTFSDATEQVRSPEIEARTPAVRSDKQSKESKRPATESTPPEHIDISVQSENEKNVFHGNYQPSDDLSEDDAVLPPLPTIDETAIESQSSASESEAESGDDAGEASQADDSEITPTATPLPGSHMHARKRASTGGPKGAVVLEPYNHQVGGHSTLFRFSRRAICKQLNNRENLFYERIERRHPDMLKFLPKYIGVLNVTYSKGTKRFKNTAAEEQSETSTNASAEIDGQEGGGHIPKQLRDEFNEAENISNLESQPRIVSQSQQTGEIPQVILDQNRHIFGGLNRPRSAVHHQRSRVVADSTMDDRYEFDASGGIGPSSDFTHDSDPGSLNHSRNSDKWGLTTVNSKLKNQVLRDVFGPPPIHKQRKHGKIHNTVPRQREPSSRRRTNLTADHTSLARRNASIPSNQSRTGLHEDVSDPKKASDSADYATPVSTPSDLYATSASVFEDVSHGLEKVRTTDSIESNGSSVSTSLRVKRRHSGMGLRRRRKSLSGEEHPDLEYFEEDDDVFHMDDAEMGSNMNRLTLSNGVPTDLVGKQDQQLFGSRTDGIDATSRSTVRPLHPHPDHLPLNPKEAQKANPDQRAVYFLLLQDLTAGMGQPCVLDLKMGTRQYGIDASKKKMESQRRKCKTTTSQQLGVRICGMQSFNVKTQKKSYEDKYFGRDVKAGREFREALTRFLYDGVRYESVSKHIPRILEKISQLENMVRRLPGYRFYASSLLIFYDAEPEKAEEALEDGPSGKPSAHREKENKKSKVTGKASPPIEVKIVDFANCVTAEDALPEGTACPPQHPEDIDRGYLRGLNTLKVYMQRILRDVNQEEYIERGEGEGMAIGMAGAGKSGATDSLIEEDGEVSI